MAELLDLYTDKEGEIGIAHNGDLKIVRGTDVILQEILWRLKTTRGDWQLVPECGADLESLVGQPNSPETGAIMEDLIFDALTHDGFLAGEIRSIRAVPINRDQILGLIVLSLTEDQNVTFMVTLDLKEGVL